MGRSVTGRAKALVSPTGTERKDAQWLTFPIDVRVLAV